MSPVEIAVVTFSCLVSVFNTVLLAVILIKDKKEPAQPVFRKVARPNPVPNLPNIVEEVEIAQSFPVIRNVRDSGAEAREKSAQHRREEMLREFPELQ